jgi:hypothetical protein
MLSGDNNDNYFLNFDFMVMPMSSRSLGCSRSHSVRSADPKEHETQTPKVVYEGIDLN